MLIVQRLAVVVATVFGVGYFPVASGTAGSLAALAVLPSLAAFRDGAPAAYALLVVAGVTLAVWAAGRAAVGWGIKDDGRIVVDEVAGMVVAGALLPATWTAAWLAFVLFRVFDVWKPFPIRRLEYLPGGIGVVADDLLAGVYAGVVARVLLSVA